jgi:protein-disulfide isomerase
MKKILMLFGLLTALLLITACNNEQVDNPDEIYVDPSIDITYSKGNANAKVIVTMFGEYECSFCSKFALEILPKIQDAYIETGKILFIFKDFPITNKQYSPKASEAAYCAGDQGEEKYWDMHIKLSENYDKLQIENLFKYADELELEPNAFKNCLETGKYSNLILRNKQQGLKLNVSNNPTLIINNEKLVGLQPFENIAKVIDTKLKE